MADTAIAITAGTGTNVDTRTEATNGNHRQVIVVGDPNTNAGVAPVDATNGLSVNVTNAALTVASHAVTNAGTFVTQENGAALTALQLLDDTVTAQGTALGTTKTSLAGGSVTTAAPTYTNGQISPLNLDTAGNLRVNVAAGGAAGGTSSTVGAAAPGTATAIGFSDGTNMQLGRIKAASTAPVATDPAIVVAISPNSVNANGQATMANSAPVAIASNQTNIPVLAGVTASSNNLTDSRVVSAASTNATSLKASAGNVYTIDVFNTAAYTVFLKFYNKASAPTVGTDTPVWTIPIPASAGFSKTLYFGKSFATGVAYAITKLQADSDTTAVVAGDLTGYIGWI